MVGLILVNMPTMLPSSSSKGFATSSSSSEILAQLDMTESELVTLSNKINIISDDQG
jgi:hypothetical protein